MKESKQSKINLQKQNNKLNKRKGQSTNFRFNLVICFFLKELQKRKTSQIKNLINRIGLGEVRIGEVRLG